MPPKSQFYPASKKQRDEQDWNKQHEEDFELFKTQCAANFIDADGNNVIMEFLRFINACMACTNLIVEGRAASQVYWNYVNKYNNLTRGEKGCCIQIVRDQLMPLAPTQDLDLLTKWMTAYYFFCVDRQAWLDQKNQEFGQVPDPSKKGFDEPNRIRQIMMHVLKLADPNPPAKGPSIFGDLSALGQKKRRLENGKMVDV